MIRKKHIVKIVILVILFINFNAKDLTFAYSYPEIDWIPNLYFTVKYDGSLESGFSSNRTIYQIVSNPGIYNGTGTADIGSGIINNTPCVPFSLSLLITKIENDIKIWEGEFVISQRVYLIDDTYGVIGTNVYKYLVSFKAYSDKGEAIKYSLKVFNEKNDILYEINEKERNEISTTIYLNERIITGSDFSLGHIGIQKEKTENCSSNDLTSIWKLYKDGNSEPMSFYGVSSLGKYKYGYTLNPITSQNTYSSLLYTNSKGILNIFDLPNGSYRLEEVSGSNSEEKLVTMNFNISNNGYQYENGNIISPIKSVKMININEKNDEGSKDNKESSENKENTSSNIKPNTTQEIKPNSKPSNNIYPISKEIDVIKNNDIEKEESINKDDVNDKSIAKENNKKHANEKLGIKGTNIKEKESNIKDNNFSFLEKLKIIISNKVNKLEIFNSKKGFVCLVPVALMVIIILFPIIIKNKRKKEDKK